MKRLDWFCIGGLLACLFLRVPLMPLLAGIGGLMGLLIGAAVLRGYRLRRET